jgi:hypothetical protein
VPTRNVTTRSTLSQRRQRRLAIVPVLLPAIPWARSPRRGTGSSTRHVHRIDYSGGRPQTVCGKHRWQTLYRSKRGSANSLANFTPN